MCVRVARSLWLFTMLLGQSFFASEMTDLVESGGRKAAAGIDMVAKEARSSGWVMRGSGWI